MAVDAHADFLQLAFEDIGGLLAGVLGDDNTSDIESLSVKDWIRRRTSAS